MTNEQHEMPSATFWEKLTWQGVVQYFQYHIPRLLGRPFPSQTLAETSVVQIPLPQIPAWRCYSIAGVKLEICDYVSSGAACHIARELGEGCYGLDKIPFEKGDVVIDIGGHVGIFAIYLARLHPDITIYAYEPIPDNFRHFQMNMVQNGVTNIHVFNKAVTRDGRSLPMTVNFSFNSGGATATWDQDQLNSASYTQYEVASLTLNSIFETHQINRCRLLKIDCEGSEYEILLNAPSLKRVEFLSAEFHTNELLRAQGYSPDMLYDHCCQFIPANNISYMTWDIPG